LVSAVAVALACAGCFTDPINMSPTVAIDPIDPPFRGDPITFTATTSDPDGDTPTLDWNRVDGPCPRAFHARSTWPTTPWHLGPDFAVSAQDTVGPFCVWARATDSAGAAVVDVRDVSPRNHPPVVKLTLDSPADAPSFQPHTMFILSASATDADGDMLNFSWAIEDEPVGSTPTLDSCQSGSQTIQCLTIDQPGDYTVSVTVDDGQMDPVTVEKTLHVAPGALPVAVIDLESPEGLGPYPLGSVLRVSGARSSGGDPDLTYMWKLQAPHGSTLAFGDCEGSGQDTQCVVASVPGNYSVGLVVKNSADESQQATANFMVAPDQPPCIESTSPDFGQSLTTADEFLVGSISDDLDGFPGNAIMQWFEAVDDGPFALVQNGFARHPFDRAQYELGAVVHVRLEVRDRNTKRGDDEFLACGKTAPTCSMPSLIHPDTCLQRVTWTEHILP
jgi:hypothetical protein